VRLYPGDIGMEPCLDPPDEGPWCVECGSEQDVEDVGDFGEPWWLCPVDREQAGADDFYGDAA
jgi:hypothetical protein